MGLKLLAVCTGQNTLLGGLTGNGAGGRFSCRVSALFPLAWQNTALQRVVFWARPKKSQRVGDLGVPSPGRKAELVFDSHPNPLACSLGGDSVGTERSLVLTPCPVVQDTGELCVQSFQCKSGCCHRTSGLSMARCAPKAAESQVCSPPVRASLLLGGTGTGLRHQCFTVPWFPADTLRDILQVSLREWLDLRR